MRRTFATSMGLVVLFTACDRQPIAPGGAPAQSADPSLLDAHLIVVPRFTIQLEVGGPIRAGEPIEVNARIGAPFGAASASVSIAAPELEVARMAGWSAPFIVPERVPIPAVASWKEPIPVGGSQARTVVLRAEKAGYYRVVVAAKAVGQEVEFLNGRTVVGTVAREFWLLVGDTSGQLQEAPDFTVLPAGTVRTVGPFRSRSAARGEAVQRGAPNAATPSYYRLLYYNSDQFAYVPVPSYFIDIDWYDNFSGFLGTLQSAADPDGYWPLQCPSSGERYDVFPVLDNYSLLSTPRSIADGFSLVDTDCGDPDGGIMQGIAINSDWAHVYTTLNTTVGNSYVFFGVLRPQVKYKVNLSDSSNTYAPTSDLITIVSVWDTYGTHAQAHEFGHALHEKALGGIVNGPVCPDPSWPSGTEHPYDRPQNLRCALVEGFASYHSWAVMGSAAWHFSEVESNAALNPGENGSIVPHVVSAFLFDLTDNGVETHDNVIYPGSYVAAIIKTCMNQVIWWRRADGVDMVIWCLERAVDPAITANPAYFATRTQDPTNQAEAAVEPPNWSKPAIRAIWLQNLYPF